VHETLKGPSGGASGPLKGIKILEFAGMGPAPFCGMLFSDLGADVLRIDRPDGEQYDRYSIESRGKRSVILDLKTPAGAEVALRLMESAEGLIEGFRPGVMERLGLGPAVAHARNPKLVYGRMTGWGQTGPYAGMAGHDINYVAVSGALHAIGPADRPAVPLNLIGDFGGGALYLAMGMLAAVLHSRETGEGQTVDCAMSEGSISLMSHLYGLLARGVWQDARTSNVIDGAAHFYNVYQCADGAWIAIAAIEPQFYAELLSKAGFEDPSPAEQRRPDRWPRLQAELAGLFRTRTREQWCSILEGTDACFAPVMSMTEARHHPQNVARRAFVDVDGVPQPAPAPRLSRTPGEIQWGPVSAGAHQGSALREWGVDESLIARLRGNA
jgi:alpha-methylacyl-CoA racemase